MTDVRSVSDDKGPVSSWATGGVVFAATMMILAGVFQAVQGLAAIIDDEFFVMLPNYTFEIDTTAWGWVHIVLGAVVAVVGLYLFSGSAIAGGVAIGLAALSAISNFLFIPYFPFWSLLIIAISVFVVWAVARSGMLES
ncbi:hypothetical protein CLV30_109120 [Haloactinopolyspora alba]|uniref:DUF7144 domain-containing protein n=1 Tax=Haloactinopolyspora alba TaxID=648780 RepID=A0A2P8E017_9ACTN|nr:hypothetical protein [Haloactinopolyspora alba]PSL02812.1 hypothetical protein CLV30_109120 [Haloactinopolyspora alba]